MVLSHLYQDFGSPDDTAVSSETSRSDVQEDARLQAFESGYQAGWDDAVKAQEQSEHRIATDFARNLESMALTYSQAQSKLCAAMQPLLIQMITQLLPDVAQKALGAHVVAQLHELVDAQSKNAIEIVVSPDNEASLRKLLEGEVEIPFDVNVDTSLSTGQVFLRVNQQEREINLDDVLIGITEAVDAFFAEFSPEVPE